MLKGVVMNRKKALWVALMQFLTVPALLFLVFGIGLLNTHDFQNKAKRQSEYVLETYFTKKGEMIEKVFPPDYSLGMIEVKVVTDKDSYYAVLEVTNPWWVEYTILNCFIAPKVVLHSVDFYDTKQRVESEGR
jgi:hypothetical protein